MRPAPFSPGIVFAAFGLIFSLLFVKETQGPTLLAEVSDVAHPEWRASAVGVYRLRRDGGYAVGALISGVLVDAMGIPFAITPIAALTFLSGMIVALVMYETLPGRRPVAVPQEPVNSKPDHS